MLGKHPAQGARTFLLWCTHTIETRLSALNTTGVRALWALIGLNGPDQPHLGPPPRPSAHGWEAYLSSGLGLCSFLKLFCGCTCSSLGHAWLFTLLIWTPTHGLTSQLGPILSPWTSVVITGPDPDLCFQLDVKPASLLWTCC